MLLTFIAAKWAEPRLPSRSFEGDYTYDQALEFNEQGFNVYYYPNQPSAESYSQIPIDPRTGEKRFIKAEDIDQFPYVFVDMDLKQGLHSSTDAFVEVLLDSGLPPTKIISSGNGTHAYWRVADLTSMSYLRLSRRLSRFFKTDPAICQLKQLMRVPDTLNVKEENNFKMCEVVVDNEDLIYEAEALDKFLPAITIEDEQLCINHFNMATGVASQATLSQALPNSFLLLCRQNSEIRSLFYDPHKNRSGADFRLAHLLFANSLTKDDAMVVLSQTAKSSERSPQHRYSYADNIVKQIWIDQSLSEQKPEAFVLMSKTVAELLRQNPDTCDIGKRFPCHEMVDATERGFRLGDVMGLIGGSGNGKSKWCLNCCLWFSERNPEYDFMYVSLEMPVEEIAAAWRAMTKDSPADLHAKVHLLGNYREDGSYRDLSLEDIQSYALQLEKHTGRKLGCIIIDHIGVLRQEKKQGEFEGLRGVCKRLKAFAKAVNCFTLVQSQTTREKNGGGDMELEMTAAFGCSDFENFADFIFTLWQPLRRIYKQAPHMTIAAFKLAKCRGMNVLKDKIKRDAVYAMKFDPDTERFRALTSDEEKAYAYWGPIATRARNADKKLEPSTLTSMDWIKK